MPLARRPYLPTSARGPSRNCEPFEGPRTASSSATTQVEQAIRIFCFSFVFRFAFLFPLVLCSAGSDLGQSKGLVSNQIAARHCERMRHPVSRQIFGSRGIELPGIRVRVAKPRTLQANLSSFSFKTHQSSFVHSVPN